MKRKITATCEVEFEVDTNGNETDTEIEVKASWTAMNLLINQLTNKAVVIKLHAPEIKKDSSGSFGDII